MASRSEPWLDEDELSVVRRVPIALSVALEVVAELRDRARARQDERTSEDGVPASTTKPRRRRG